MKNRAIVAGHICIDITPVFPDNAQKFCSVSEILKPGKLITTNAPDIHTGGTVANTGLAMKILGADVKLLGKIGDDGFGKLVENVLRKFHAEDDLIISQNSVTSYSVVIAIPGIDRIFLHCPGANDEFMCSDISDDALDDATLFHFGYPPLMRSMFVDDGSELVKIFKRVREREISTSLDLAAVDLGSESGRANWGKILASVLPYVDFFVPSFEELCLMLRREKYDEIIARANGRDITEVLDFESDIKPLAEICLELGAKCVLIKCGSPGIYLRTSGSMNRIGKRLKINHASWNNFSRFERSYKISQVLSGTGAGDTSIAAFLTSILEGFNPAESLQNAAAAGALCCTAYDAISGLKNLREIRAMIDAGWEKNL